MQKITICYIKCNQKQKYLKNIKKILPKQQLKKKYSFDKYVISKIKMYY